MTIKIDAPRAYGHIHRKGQSDNNLVGKLDSVAMDDATEYCSAAVRIVRESDWRKVMAVIRAADHNTNGAGGAFWPNEYAGTIGAAVVSLRKHLEKRK